MNFKRTAPAIGSRMLVATLSAGLIFGSMPVTAFAESSSDLQAQLEQAQAKAAEYESQAAAAFQEFEELQGNLEDTKAQISTTQEEIEQKQAELSEAQDTLASRVASNYKTGGVSIFSILFDSASFEDLVSRVYYANRVADSDAAAINQVQTVQAELNTKQSELQAQEAEQQQLVDESQAKATEIQNTLSEQQSYVSSLSTEVQEALAAEEAARKAEAEAAAKAAEEQAASSSSSSNSGSSNSSSNSSSSSSSSSNSGSSSSGSSSSGSSSSGGSSHNYGSGISAVIAAARSQLGVSYSYSGNAIANQEFDCSGLVWWSFQQAGISIPRGQRMSNGRSSSMIGWCLDGGGWVTSTSQLSVGDLVFYGSSVNATYHVAIYIGGGQIIHSIPGGVQISNVNSNWGGNFVGGGPVV